MGIDIYLGGYAAYNRRIRKERAAFEAAVKLRDSFPEHSRKAVAAQKLVENAADAMWSGSKGYLRSSYNNAGLFAGLDRLFGIDSAALLFPGDWGKDNLAVDWEQFLTVVCAMEQAATALKHGVRLPVRLMPEGSAPVHEQRRAGEAFGAKVFAAVAEMGFDHVESGNDHQHGFYNVDDYEWYITEGLRDLRDFGELGLRLHQRGHNDKVTISY